MSRPEEIGAGMILKQLDLVAEQVRMAFLCLTDLLEERDAWRNAAEAAWHLPTHDTKFGPLNCWQCAEALMALQKATELSTHPLDNIDWDQEMLNDAQ